MILRLKKWEQGNLAAWETWINSRFFNRTNRVLNRSQKKTKVAFYLINLFKMIATTMVILLKMKQKNKNGRPEKLCWILIMDIRKTQLFMKMTIASLRWSNLLKTYIEKWRAIWPSSTVDTLKLEGFIKVKTTRLKTFKTFLRITHTQILTIKIG